MLKQKMLLILLGLGILFACIVPEDDFCSAKLLESVLDAYIESCSIENSQCIVVSQTTGWTDSTDLITIFSHEKERYDYADLMLSEYRGFPIYYAYGSLNGYPNYASDLSRFDEALPNNLKWTKVEISKKHDNTDEEIGNPEEFDQVHFVYQPSLKSIQEVLLDRNGFGRKILIACPSCTKHS